jgi:Icc-related predicted phosphoesterase
MICSASLSFGNRPNAAQKEKALAEFRMLKADLGRLREGVSVYMVPGNHDTYPGEKDAALLRQVFPEAAAYSERELAGVSLFFLNAGSSGDFDEAQREWLRKRTLALPAEREAILFVHQPALGATVSERGVAVGLSEAFADYRGPLWMLSGHHHRNSDAVFALPRTTVVQAAMTTCNLTGWGGPEKPGYWVYCLQDGTVKARIFRRYEKGYRVAPLPNRAKARPITPPFDGVDNVVKTVFVGDGDREYLVSSKAADVVSWWGYLSEVTYRFPASLFERTPTQIGILASLSHTHKDVERRGHVFLSGDGETWVEAELASPEKGVYTVPLPDTVRASDAIHVRVTGPGYKGGVSLAGFAFCAPPVE